MDRWQQTGHENEGKKNRQSKILFSSRILIQDLEYRDGTSQNMCCICVNVEIVVGKETKITRLTKPTAP